MSAVAGDSKRIRVAVVGTGEFGETTRDLQELEGVESSASMTKAPKRAGLQRKNFRRHRSIVWRSCAGEWMPQAWLSRQSPTQPLAAALWKWP